MSFYSKLIVFIRLNPIDQQECLQKNVCKLDIKSQDTNFLSSSSARLFFCTFPFLKCLHPFPPLFSEVPTIFLVSFPVPVMAFKSAVPRCKKKIPKR